MNGNLGEIKHSAIGDSFGKCADIGWYMKPFIVLNIGILPFTRDERQVAYNRNSREKSTT